MESGTPSRDTERAVSEENVEIVRGVYSEWERGNFWTADYFHPDIHVRWFAPIAAPAGAETHGIEELTRGMREVLGSYERMTCTAERIIDAGDQVVSVELWQGRGKASGIETESRNSSLWRFADGKVIYLANYGNQSGALEAAGLSE
jgi:ketosteroid isomerase-like protein